MNRRWFPRTVWTQRFAVFVFTEYTFYPFIAALGVIELLQSADTEDLFSPVFTHGPFAVTRFNVSFSLCFYFPGLRWPECAGGSSSPRSSSSVTL